MDSHQLNPQFLFDALYCEEERWDSEELIHRDRSLEISLNQQPFIELSEQDLFEGGLSSLLHKEQEIELYNGFEESPSLVNARGEAVEWILKVIGYHSFSAVTAVLAVNYLDRFLSSFHCGGEKPWLAQLAAVACLSLAAKVEETQVPPLLGLQVEESNYVFDSKKIQRMEILVLSTLKWKMNPVTPLSFIDYIVTRLGLKSHICREFLRRCESLILSLVSDCRFTSYLPSAMATATMLYAITSLESFTAVEYKDKLMGILGINKDKVEECCRLIQEVATSVDLGSFNKRKFGSSIPESPKGVVGVCFSTECDSSDDSWLLAASTASVSSSPEPLSKKIKSQ